MQKSQRIRSALTIAGSDSGGGAGIQADLKTFASLGVHGTSAITCVTAQNPRGVFGIQACEPKLVRKQIEAVCSEFRPAAVKTGMLYSAPIIRAVTNYFRSRKVRVPLVVDPVMIATSGADLLSKAAHKVLIRELLPIATLVTPNLDEVEVITGARPASIEEMRQAARTIYAEMGCAVLVKGGHLPDSREAADIFFDGTTELLLTAPFVRNVSTHGTGCTYSAAITGYLATGESLVSAVTLAKNYITAAIQQNQRVGNHTVLNSFHEKS